MSILGQVWYLIVSIPDLCTLTYFLGIYEKNKIIKSDIFLVVYYYLTLFDIPKATSKCISKQNVM